MDDWKITANVRQTVADIVTLAVAMQPTPSYGSVRRAVNVRFNAEMGYLIAEFYKTAVESDAKDYKFEYYQLAESPTTSEEKILTQLNELYVRIAVYLSGGDSA